MNYFRSVFLTASLSVLLSATASLAEDNKVDVGIGTKAKDTTVAHSLKGTGNTLAVRVGDTAPTASTKVSIDQVGDGNSLHANINGSRGNYNLGQIGNANQMTATSLGDSNTIRAAQKGNSNLATLDQAGTNNTITGRASELAPPSSQVSEYTAGVIQNGEANQLIVSQRGDYHNLSVGQDGSNNVATISQTQRNTLVNLSQTGNGNSANLSSENARADNGGGLDVSQKGNKNDAKARLGKGIGTIASIQQVGDGHIATLDAIGSRNNLSIIQNGTADTAHLTVNGDGNTAKLAQTEGSKNVINANIGGADSAGPCLSCVGAGPATGNTMLITQTNVSNQTVNAGISGNANKMDVNLGASNTTATYAMSGAGNVLIAR